MNGLSPEAEELLATVRSGEVPDEAARARAGRELLRRLVAGGSLTAISGTSLVAAASKGVASSGASALATQTTLGASAATTSAATTSAATTSAAGSGAGGTAAALATKVLGTKVALIATVALVGGGIVGGWAVHERRQSVAHTAAQPSQVPSAASPPLDFQRAAPVPLLQLGASVPAAVPLPSPQDTSDSEGPARGADARPALGAPETSKAAGRAAMSNSRGPSPASPTLAQEASPHDVESSADFAAVSHGVVDAAAQVRSKTLAASDSNTLREQADQLRQAERALTAGDPSAALKILADSDERHGTAQGAAGLGLEREALRLIARCKGNAVQQREGRAAASRFLAVHAAHPLVERVRRDCGQ